MRKQFVKTVESILEKNKKTVLLLGDIGVFGFKKAFALFPDRVFNIGILEQSTVGLAAGLSMQGLIPIVHTIAPFLVERSIEQLKNDFCYQKLGGNFVSVGASYDYAVLGCTHHCPGDVGMLKNIPDMEIILPGTAEEFDKLFRQSYANGNPTYFRLSEKQNSKSHNVNFGKAEIVKKGKLATIIAVGTMLELAIVATEGLDVTILYYTTVAPFDKKTLMENSDSGKILLCEPYYAGALLPEILETMSSKPISIESIGVPNRMMTNYGTACEHDESIGFTYKNIREKLLKLIKQ